MENLKARELRIGNYVIFNTNDIPFRITAAGILDMATHENKGLPFFHIPIPLTEDILLKCGFERYRLSFSNRFTLNRITLFSIDNVFYVKFNGNNVKVEFVHDLQNICYYHNNKQELTIKL